MLSFLFKNREKRKLEKKVKKSGLCFSQFIYQDNNIENISNMFSNGKTFNTYEERTEFIKELLSNKDNEYITEFSNVITIYIFQEVNLADAFEISSNFTDTRLKYNAEEKLYYLLISGSIKEYKDCIRNIDISNSIGQCMIETLYLTNACYFEDFIIDRIMDKTSFNYYDNIEFKYISGLSEECNITIYEISPVHEILNRVQAYGFNIEDVINSSRIIFTGNEYTVPVIWKFLEFYKINKNVKCDKNSAEFYDYVEDQLDNMIDDIGKYTIPKYKRIEQDMSEYDSIDEPLDEVIENSYKKPEDLIHEDENGDIIYDEENFI